MITGFELPWWVYAIYTLLIVLGAGVICYLVYLLVNVVGIPFEKNGKIGTITGKELLARVWPFGKWDIIWKHAIDGEHPGKNPLNKTDAVNSYHMWKDKGFMKVVRIRKKGGFLNGIEYTPRTRGTGKQQTV